MRCDVRIFRQNALRLCYLDARRVRRYPSLPLALLNSKIYRFPKYTLLGGDGAILHFTFIVLVYRFGYSLLN